MANSMMNNVMNLKKNNTRFLPEKPEDGVLTLVKITQKLILLADREAQTLIQGDLLGLAVIQDEKEAISLHYSRASQEFRSNLEDFRQVDRVLLDRLEALQKELSDKTKSNSKVIENAYDRSKKKSHDSLIKAQEMGQIVSAHELGKFPKVTFSDDCEVGGKNA